MRTINVSLSDELIDFVNVQVREGGYASPSAVVGEGLRLLHERHEKRALLIAMLEEGRADTEAERTVPLSDDLLQDIGRRGRERAAARNQVRGIA